MSRNSSVHSLRKELLQLQAEQIRMALRQDLTNLRYAPGQAVAENSAQWLESISSVLGSILPGRWGRWLNLGLMVWRLLGRSGLLTKVRADSGKV